MRRLLNNKLFKEALEAAEKEIYLEAYKYNEYNQVVTANALGVARNTLRAKLKKWGVL